MHPATATPADGMKLSIEGVRTATAEHRMSKTESFCPEDVPPLMTFPILPFPPEWAPQHQYEGRHPSEEDRYAPSGERGGGTNALPVRRTSTIMMTLLTRRLHVEVSECIGAPIFSLCYVKANRDAAVCHQQVSNSLF